MRSRSRWRSPPPRRGGARSTVTGTRGPMVGGRSFFPSFAFPSNPPRFGEPTSHRPPSAPRRRSPSRACLWSHAGGFEAARFCASPFPDSPIDAVHGSTEGVYSSSPSLPLSAEDRQVPVPRSTSTRFARESPGGSAAVGHQTFARSGCGIGRSRKIATLSRRNAILRGRRRWLGSIAPARSVVPGRRLAAGRQVPTEPRHTRVSSIPSPACPSGHRKPTAQRQ